MNTGEKSVCRFDGPTARHYVEVVQLDSAQYRVYRVQPFPPPTRGDKVGRFDVDGGYLAAINLGAYLVREAW